MHDDLKPMTIQSILEEFATIPSAEQNWLPRKQRIYQLFRYFSPGKQSGFSVKLQYCPDFDPTSKWFNSEEIVLPNGFLLPHRKNIVILIDMWNFHPHGNYEKTEWTHYPIPLPDLDKLFTLKSALLRDELFDESLHVQNNGPEFKAVFNFRYRNEHKSTNEIQPICFYNSNKLLIRSKERYKEWFTSFAIEYSRLQKDGKASIRPWSICCFFVPKKNTCVKNEDSRYEMMPIFSGAHGSEIIIRFDDSTLLKAISAIQQGVIDWFSGTLA